MLICSVSCSGAGVRGRTLGATGKSGRPFPEVRPIARSWPQGSISPDPTLGKKTCYPNCFRMSRRLALVAVPFATSAWSMSTRHFHPGVVRVFMDTTKILWSLCDRAVISTRGGVSLVGPATTSRVNISSEKQVVLLPPPSLFVVFGPHRCRFAKMFALDFFPRTRQRCTQKNTSFHKMSAYAQDAPQQAAQLTTLGGRCAVAAGKMYDPKYLTKKNCLSKPAFATYWNKWGRLVGLHHGINFNVRCFESLCYVSWGQRKNTNRTFLRRGFPSMVKFRSGLLTSFPIGVASSGGEPKTGKPSLSMRCFGKSSGHSSG